MKHLKPLPALELLQPVFQYEPERGILFRTWKSGKTTVAGTPHPKGYLAVFFLKQTIRVHRLCWALYHKQDPYPFEVDHRDNDRTNNAIFNLRLTDSLGNKHNSVAKQDRNSTGYHGVHRQGARFRSCISVDNRTIHLGTFDTPEEASIAYIEAKNAIAGGFSPYI